MTVAPIQFSQKWDLMISPHQEKTHVTAASRNHLIWIASVVSSIVLTVLGSLTFGDLTMGVIGAALLFTPVVEISKFFLAKARGSRKLEEQSQKVRVIYERLIAEKAPHPEATALSLHWKEKALKSKEEYDTLYTKAIEKEKEPDVSFSALRRYRLEALEAGKEAATLKVYSLFLDSLVGHAKTFEKAFLRHGETLDHAIPEFATWDPRDAEARLLDSQFGKEDLLLRFNRDDIAPISYQELFQDNLEPYLKARLAYALRTRQFT